MRWNDLFADLEGQLGAANDAQFSSEVADRTRSERASTPLESRLAGVVGDHLAVTLQDGDRVSGALSEVASTWIMIVDGTHQSWIPLAAVVSVAELGSGVTELSTVARRLSVGHALRALSRDRAEVMVCTTAGRWPGIIAHVGADYVETHDRTNGTTTAVPFAAITRVFTAGSVH